jgi:glycosyltransferase involved in cell wall biosynthesis
LKYHGSNISLLLTKRMESSISKKDFLHKQLYKRVSYILAISNLIKKNVLETCPVSEEKVILHYNGVDLTQFDPAKANRMKIRKEFNIKDEEIVIGMLARISFGKGYEELIKAAGKLIKEFPNLKFLMAGEASPDEKEYEGSIKKLVKDLYMEEKVILTGFRKDAVDLLSAMDIFAFPSHSESFGNSLIEAMAMEKPSVATNSHGILDIIDDGKTGFLFNRKDENDLAEKLKNLIISPVKRITIGKEARKHVTKNFDLEKQTQKLIDLYKNLEK